jgi:phosphinothricin acetyltransferase
MEVRSFDLGEAHRGDLEKLLFQLSGKKRELNLTKYSDVRCVGAFDEDRLIGFAQLFVLPKTTFVMGYLEDVIVLEEYRGQGLGRKILDKVIEVAKEQNCESITLTTRPERIAAKSLFESMGFAEPGNQTLRLTLEG